jgi:hypothetical protein
LGAAARAARARPGSALAPAAPGLPGRGVRRGPRGGCARGGGVRARGRPQQQQRRGAAPGRRGPGARGPRLGAAARAAHARLGRALTPAALGLVGRGVRGSPQGGCARGGRVRAGRSAGVPGPRGPGWASPPGPRPHPSRPRTWQGCIRTGGALIALIAGTRGMAQGRPQQQQQQQQQGRRGAGGAGCRQRSGAKNGDRGGGFEGMLRGNPLVGLLPVGEVGGPTTTTIRAGVGRSVGPQAACTVTCQWPRMGMCERSITRHDRHARDERVVLSVGAACGLVWLRRAGGYV